MSEEKHFNKKILIGFVCIVFLYLIYVARNNENFWQPMLSNLLRRSYVETNVPEKPFFNEFLSRDLEDSLSIYYGKEVTVKYESLRDAPTQVGTAYPKYYLWITVYEKGQELEQGAVRVAAIEKDRFEITHYLTKEQIKENPELIYNIFPKAVGDEIKNKYE